MMNYICRPGNVFTASSLFCGFYSIVLSAGADAGDLASFQSAAYLILFACLFDLLDGPVARLTRTMSEFGRQLDSLADLVSFGIAPGVLLYKWGLAGFELVGFVIAFLFVLAGAFRLARFNLGVDDEDKAYVRGLTITVSGTTVALLVIQHCRTGHFLLDSQFAILLFTLFLSYLMISDIRFRTHKAMRANLRTVVLGSLGVFAIIYIAIAFDLSLCLLVLCTLYIGIGVAEEAFTRRHRRWEFLSVESLFEIDDDEEQEALLGSMDEDDDLAPVGQLDGRRRRWRWPFRKL